MPVYVDDMRARFGRYVFCHMLADTDEELHAMAARIGVARKWFQAPPAHDSHYDIALTKRAAALRLGAVKVTWRQMAAMNLRRRITGQLGEPHDAEAWAQAYYLARKLTRPLPTPPESGQ